MLILRHGRSFLGTCKIWLLFFLRVKNAQYSVFLPEKKRGGESKESCDESGSLLEHVVPHMWSENAGKT